MESGIRFSSESNENPLKRSKELWNSIDATVEDLVKNVERVRDLKTAKKLRLVGNKR